jgi:polar amino acid transport system ATP-binding protein/sulfate transport system ATP-binding protein
MVAKYIITDEVLLSIKDVYQEFTEETHNWLGFKKNAVNVVLAGVNHEIRNITRPGIKQGQVVSILGPSGIGKTTLFEVIAGLLTQTQGTVLVRNPEYVHGQKETEPIMIPVKPGDVGVVYQKYPLFEDMNVYKNLMIGARQGGLKEKDAKEKVIMYLDQFDLREHIKKYPEQLSGGQRQRVAIAQQLLCSNSLLLMDEPFSGLDPGVKNEVCHSIASLAQTNELMTIIIVTHDVRSAVAISDHIMVMGRNRDPETNEVIAGASILHTYDLAEMGMAWDPEIQDKPEFQEFSNKLEKMFPVLAGK